MYWRRFVTAVEVAIASAAAISKVALSNGHCTWFRFWYWENAVLEDYIKLEMYLMLRISHASILVKRAKPIKTYYKNYETFEIYNHYNDKHITWLIWEKKTIFLVPSNKMDSLLQQRIYNCQSCDVKWSLYPFINRGFRFELLW